MGEVEVLLEGRGNWDCQNSLLQEGESRLVLTTVVVVVLLLVVVAAQEAWRQEEDISQH